MTKPKLHLGTMDWFKMVGTLMCEHASLARLPQEMNVWLVERYIDGAELAGGLFQGIRFDLIAGKPWFRAGVLAGERGDVAIEITVAASRRLNALRSADPNYLAAIDCLRAAGQMRVEGDLSRIGDWLKAVHDAIVDQTIQPLSQSPSVWGSHRQSMATLESIECLSLAPAAEPPRHDRLVRKPVSLPRIMV
ncbi:conserved hypothetical protein [Mesorhizobium sp. ORS 3359]|nr:conserved hypothetical protein [Mesorhizobium sp. ORS 3359]